MSTYSGSGVRTRIAKAPPQRRPHKYSMLIVALIQTFCNEPSRWWHCTRSIVGMTARGYTCRQDKRNGPMLPPYATAPFEIAVNRDSNVRGRNAALPMIGH